MYFIIKRKNIEKLMDATQIVDMKDLTPLDTV